MKFWEWVKQALDGQIIPLFFRRFSANGFKAKEDDAKTNAARAAAEDRRMRLDDK